jgi:inner membrane protein
MMNSTQAVFSVTLTALALGTADPRVLAVAAIAAQFPDIDTSKSWIGRLPPFCFISRWLEKRFTHRTLTHSFVFSLGLGIVSFPIFLRWPGVWFGVNLGYFLGWYADNFTKQGVCAFWPHPGRLVTPANPRHRLTTGSSAEYVLLLFLVAICIAIINLNSSGGILKAFNQALGLSNGAVEIVAAEQNQYLLSAHINGRNSLTQQAVLGDFEVVQPLTQSDLLVRQGDKIFRAGSSQESQILVSQVQIKRLGRVKPSIQEIKLEEESGGGASIAEALGGVGGDRVYITGLVLVQDAEDLIPPNYPDRFNTIRVQPGSGITAVHIEVASPTEIREVLGEFSGRGSLLVRSLNVQ